MLCFQRLTQGREGCLPCHRCAVCQPGGLEPARALPAGTSRRQARAVRRGQNCAVGKCQGGGESSPQVTGGGGGGSMLEQYDEAKKGSP